MVLLDQGLTEFEANRDHPAAMQQLAQLDQAISGGTTAVIVVVHQNRLCVANVGDSRALLCKTDENGILKVGRVCGRERREWALLGRPRGPLRLPMIGRCHSYNSAETERIMARLWCFTGFC